LIKKPSTTPNHLKLAREFLGWHAAYERRDLEVMKLGKDAQMTEAMRAFKRDYAKKESEAVVDFVAD
jgi:hypothetical protein